MNIYNKRFNTKTGQTVYVFGDNLYTNGLQVDNGSYMTWQRRMRSEFQLLVTERVTLELKAQVVKQVTTLMKKM